MCMVRGCLLVHCATVIYCTPFLCMGQCPEESEGPLRATHCGTSHFKQYLMNRNHLTFDHNQQLNWHTKNCSNLYRFNQLLCGKMGEVVTFQADHCLWQAEHQCPISPEKILSLHKCNFINKALIVEPQQRIPARFYRTEDDMTFVSNEHSIKYWLMDCI